MRCRRSLAVAVADLVVAELLVVAVVVLEAAVPSSPRWRCWSPIAAVVAVPALVTELVVVAVAGVSSRDEAGARTPGVPFPSPRGIRWRAQVGLSRRTEKATGS
jgi:hypothetical protein